MNPRQIAANKGAGAIRTKINRIGEPADIGHAVLWLAADHLNATTMFVDGGMSAYPGFRGAG